MVLRQLLVLSLLVWMSVVNVKAQTIDTSMVINEPKLPENLNLLSPLLIGNENFSPINQEFPGIDPIIGFSPIGFRLPGTIPLVQANFKTLDILSSIKVKQTFSVHADLLGYYRQGKLKLNDKLSIYSATAMPNTSFNAWTVFPGKMPVLNYGTSFEVGYKFSDKFSVRAGFSVGRYDYPY